MGTAPSYIIHLKGFASGIEKKDLDAVKLYQCIPKGKIRFVWDGDNYATDSFTYIVKKLMERKEANWGFDAFKKKGEIQSFKDSWAPEIENLALINVHVVDDSLSWDKLGLEALKYSMENSDNAEISIIYIGGGKTIEDELKMPLPKPVKLYFYNVPRTRKGIEERLFLFKGDFPVRKDVFVPQLVAPIDML